MRLSIVSSVGPKTQTLKMCEQTIKHAISKEFTESPPCYFLLDGFTSNLFFFIFRIIQAVFESFRILQAMFNSRKKLLLQLLLQITAEDSDKI